MNKNEFEYKKNHLKTNKKMRSVISRFVPLFRNSYYFIPKNTLTYEYSHQEFNTYFMNNFMKCGFDMIYERKEKGWKYEVIHYSNNRLYTNLEIEDTKNGKMNEYFYVKPDSVYNDFAKIIYGLTINEEKLYQIDYNVLYDDRKNKYNYAVFDKDRIRDILSKNYLK